MGKPERRHILLAEDEEGLQVVLSLMLRQAGYLVTLAASGFEACRLVAGLASGSGIDLVLMDLDKPESGGDQFLHQLALSGLPVIVLSGSAEKPDLPGLDCRGCIGKPLDPGVLMDGIQGALSRAGLFPEPRES